MHRTLAAALAGLLALASCAGNGKPSGGHAAGAAGPGPYRDVVAVSDLRERAIAMLTKAAGAEAPAIRANALEGLSAAGARVDTLLPAALHDSNEGVRTVAAMIVGRLGLSGHAAEIAALRSDPSPYVRAAAVYAGARIGTNPDVSPLAGLLRRSTRYRVKAQVVYVLGELGNGSAAAMIAESVNTPVPSGHEGEARLFQLQVAEALVKLGADDQREVLHAALYPSQANELEATALATQIVGQLRDKSATGDLINLVEYKDPEGNRMPAEVRLAAATALARLGQPNGTYIADEYRQNERPAVRAQAASVYGDLGLRENLDKLAAMLDDPSAIVRVSAATAIIHATAD
ncbi:MAG: HEAT repeat domain-containing protein [Phycisphaerales bacterium]|nr:HEAT repeat domain-containing protein [Phycisphaerales bacterium]